MTAKRLMLSVSSSEQKVLELQEDQNPNQMMLRNCPKARHPMNLLHTHGRSRQTSMMSGQRAVVRLDRDYPFRQCLVNRTRSFLAFAVALVFAAVARMLAVVVVVAGAVMLMLLRLLRSSFAVVASLLAFVAFFASLLVDTGTASALAGSAAPAKQASVACIQVGFPWMVIPCRFVKSAFSHRINRLL